MHRERVAIRRLRSALRTFAPLLDRDWAKAQREKLRGLSDELSAARDADIVLARARADVASLDAPNVLAADAILGALVAARNDAYARLRQMRADPSHAALSQELAAIARRSAVPNPQEQVADTMRPILAKVSKRLRSCARRCSKPPTDDELHAVRIAAKHLRYALEAFSPLAGRKLKRAAKRVERLQDVLGEEHDATFTAARLAELQKDPRMAAAAGEMARMERKAAERARSRWRRAWRRVRQDG